MAKRKARNSSYNRDKVPRRKSRDSAPVYTENVQGDREPGTSTDAFALPPPGGQQKRAANRNSKKSLLLRLPAEIRTRIYNNVLGNHTIHIWSDQSDETDLEPGNGGTLLRSVCRRNECTTGSGPTEEEAERVKSGQHCEGGMHLSYSTHTSHFNRHNLCKYGIVNAAIRRNEKRDDSSFLDLLLVCRQTHNEACLLPFAESSFAFTWIVDLEIFVTRLNSAQLKAIQHISFFYHAFNSDTAFEDLLRETLCDLKSLIVFVEFRGTQETGPCGVNHLEFAQEAEKRQEVKDTILRFRRLKIEDVQVGAYNAPFTGTVSCGRVPSARIAPWVKAVEEELMEDGTRKNLTRRSERIPVRRPETTREDGNRCH